VGGEGKRWGGEGERNDPNIVYTYEQKKKKSIAPGIALSRVQLLLRNVKYPI
jgi:hypothetical protein